MGSRNRRILVAEGKRFSPRAEGILRKLGQLHMGDLDRFGLLRAVSDVDVLWVRLRHRIDSEVMALAPRLKFIVSPTTGLNHIDLAEAEQRGIRVISLRGQTGFLKDIRATAEHTIAITLALLRHLPGACAHATSGGWNRDLFWGHELHGKTVGIVGYGRLGRIVAEYFKVFGCHVLTTDPFIGSADMAFGVSLVPPAELLATADIVTLHVNLSDTTKKFFGPGQFAQMNTGAWFINTARGELVDEAALLAALHSGHLAGAAVDVLTDECSAGMGGHPLVQYARTQGNLLITPHVGGCTFESIEKTELFLAEKLRSLLVAPNS
jgi:D-3-phosphoglycerate dehydrogenase